MRGGHPPAREHLPRLPGPVSAGRRVTSVLNGPDEPHALRRKGRLHRDGLLVEEGGQGGAEGGDRPDFRHDGGRQLHANPATVGVEARPRRRLPALDVQRDHPRRRMEAGARGGSGPSRLRRILRYLQPPDRRFEVRPDLCGSAKESRAFRRHARHPQERLARARAEEPSRPKTSPSTTRLPSSASTSCVWS